MWRFRRVSDDKFLLHGSHRKSSVRAPGVPPEAAIDVDVIKDVDEVVVICDDGKRFILAGAKSEREREKGKRPIISQSSTSHHHHIYKNTVCLPIGGKFVHVAGEPFAD